MGPVFPPGAVVQRDAMNRTIIMVKGKNLSKKLERDGTFRELQSENRFADIALDFIDYYHRQFRLNRVAGELVVMSTARLRGPSVAERSPADPR